MFGQKQGIRLDMHELVRRFGFMNCSDPRDRAFALYGLLGEGSDQYSNVLIVDYSLSPVQLSIRILRLASRSIKHLEPLKEFHVWLDAALEVNSWDFDLAANKERELILKGAYNGSDDDSLRHRSSSTLSSMLRLSRGLSSMSLFSSELDFEYDWGGRLDPDFDGVFTGNLEDSLDDILDKHVSKKFY